MIQPWLMVTGMRGALGNTVAHVQVGGQAELGRYRVEIVRIGAEAVHPDHGCRGRPVRFDFKRFEMGRRGQNVRPVACSCVR